MSHVFSVFGKDIYQLELKDIVSFFSTPQEESSIVEFKAGGVSPEAIYKEVCAFLNTDGGVLILGSPKETCTDNKTKVCQGEPEPCFTISNQERLMHLIGANIMPLPTNIKVKSIPYKVGNIYVLEVPKSITPPHQVSNEGRYYIRLEREAKPAPHGIVQALMNQTIPVRLTHQIGVKKLKVVPGHYVRYEIRIRIGNDSPYAAHDVEMFLGVMGNINEVPVKDKTVFIKKQIPQNRTYLTITRKSDNAIINDLFWMNSFVVDSLSDTFYMHLGIWARDSMSISKFYHFDFNKGLTGNDTREESSLKNTIKRFLGHKI